MMFPEMADSAPESRLGLSLFRAGLRSWERMVYFGLPLFLGNFPSRA